jgi:hypothetical protein
MDRKRGLNISSLLAAVAAFSAGCLADADTPADPQPELRQSAVLGVDEFLYFRSNATGWGVDDSTRLAPFGGGAFARTYNVTQDWMVSGGDTAIVTRTNQLNGWGTSQTFYGAATQPVVVPATATVVPQAPGGDAHFKVKYGVLGLHRVIVALSSTPPIIQIDSAASACAGVCPAGLTCSLMSNGIPTCSEPPPTGP